MTRLSAVQASRRVARRWVAAIAVCVRVLLSVLLILLFVPGYSAIAPGPRLRSHGRMVVRPVLLDSHDPARRHIGQLTFLGGISLASNDPAFGGYSSMRVVGDRFTLLSDGGNWIDFRMGDDWRIRALHFANLPAGPGTGWEKRDRDSESMTADPAGHIWVGFERYNAIWRYAPGFAHAERRARPQVMAHWPSNGGPESMVRLRDGHFIVLSETGRWPHAKGHAAYLFDGDPTVDPSAGFAFAYAPPHGYDPSDAVELPDGDVLVLNRRFSLPYIFTAILTIVPRAQIAPGNIVAGRPIATFAAPFIHDNFEALAVTREAGRTIIWMASDDNQSVLQRSLLLKFQLDPADTTTASPR